MGIRHDFDLAGGRGQPRGLIGPNGAGKSTVLHSIFGCTNVFSGTVSVDGRDVTRLSPQEKLKAAGIAYILQDKSVFPGMTVEENLLIGGFLKNSVDEAREATERVFAKYDQIGRASCRERVRQAVYISVVAVY